MRQKNKYTNAGFTFVKIIMSRIFVDNPGNGKMNTQDIMILKNGITY